MNNEIQNIIRFYRDCYQFEYSSEKVSNFYSKNVSYLYYPETFQVLSQNKYLLPVSSEWGEDMSAELELSSSEKKLVCGSFFVKGKNQVLGKTQKIFTPLFLHDIELGLLNETFTLEVNLESISINPIAINHLNSLDNENSYSFEDISELILKEENIFSFKGLNYLLDLLEEKYPSLNIDFINQRIKTSNRISSLEFICNSRKPMYEKTIFPDIIIGLVERQKKSKGVLNELTELSSRKHHPYSILNHIFNNNSKNELKKKSEYDTIVPVSLSKSQEQIIQSSYSSKISVVIGPPGTGKSFSIAALAVQAFSEGKKILIASKNEQACTVVNNKIIEDMRIRGISINASKARFRLSVAARLRNIVNGFGSRKVSQKVFDKEVTELQKLKRKYEKLAKEISEREIQEKNWGGKLSKTNKNLFKKIQKEWIRYKHNSKSIIWELKYELHNLDKKIKNHEKYLLELWYKKKLYNLLGRNRPELLKYEKAFKEDKGNVINKIFSNVNFDVILKALPIWICKSSEVSNIVPLKEELFDLLIIDEASQCDISSSLPLIYRAKSVVIVGDPNQLRHISFISNRKEKLTKEKYNINIPNIGYRDKSILDLINESVSSQENVIFLNEHYRSMPDIIDFSNHHFYSGELQIMTEHLNKKNVDNFKVNILENGKRNEKGENQVEAKKIIKTILSIIKNEDSRVDNNSSTIGIISPFRGQVNLIKKLIKNKIEPDLIKKHKILVGTPHNFQGEERDIILLSFTIDKNTHPGTIRYLEKPDVFNVSITRAKYFKDVYISIDPKELNSDTLLAKYLTKQYNHFIDVPNDPQYDEFLLEVKQFLEKNNAGIIHIERMICGTNIDIVITQEKRTIGIDLVGFPGNYTQQLTIDEIKSLERAKIDIFLLPYSTWHFDKTLCKESLTEFLKLKR